MYHCLILYFFMVVMPAGSIGSTYNLITIIEKAMEMIHIYLGSVQSVKLANVKNAIIIIYS